MKQEFLNEQQAAAFLGLSHKTLSRWRWAGQGPCYYKFGGAVRYALAELVGYTTANMRGTHNLSCDGETQ